MSQPSNNNPDAAQDDDNDEKSLTDIQPVPHVFETIYNSGRCSLAYPLESELSPAPNQQPQNGEQISWGDYLNNETVASYESAVYNNCPSQNQARGVASNTNRRHRRSCSAPTVSSIPFDTGGINAQGLQNERITYQQMVQEWGVWFLWGANHRGEPPPKGFHQISDDTKVFFLANIFKNRILQMLGEKLEKKISPEEVKKLVELKYTSAEFEGNKLGHELLKRIPEDQANKHVEKMTDRWIEELAPPMPVTDTERSIQRQIGFKPEITAEWLDSQRRFLEVENAALSQPNLGIEELKHLPPGPPRPSVPELMSLSALEMVLDGWDLDKGGFTSGAGQVFMEDVEDTPESLGQELSTVEQQGVVNDEPRAKKPRLHQDEAEIVEAPEVYMGLDVQETRPVQVQTEAPDNHSSPLRNSSPKLLPTSPPILEHSTIVEAETEPNTPYNHRPQLGRSSPEYLPSSPPVFERSTIDGADSDILSDPSPQLQATPMCTFAMDVEAGDGIFQNFSSPSKQILDDSDDFAQHSPTSVASFKTATGFSSEADSDAEDEVSLFPTGPAKTTNDGGDSSTALTPLKVSKGGKAPSAPSSPPKTAAKNSAIKDKRTSNVFAIVENRGRASPNGGSEWSWVAPHRAIQPAVKFSMNKPAPKPGLGSEDRGSENGTKKPDPVENTPLRKSRPLKSTYNPQQTRPESPAQVPTKSWAYGNSNYAVVVESSQMEASNSMSASGTNRSSSGYDRSLTSAPAEAARPFSFKLPAPKKSDTLARAVANEIGSGPTAGLLPQRQDQDSPPRRHGDAAQQDHVDNHRHGSQNSGHLSSRERFRQTGKGPRGFSQSSNATRPPRMVVDAPMQNMTTISNRYLRTDSPAMSVFHAARVQTPTPTREYGRGGSISPPDNLRNVLPPRPTHRQGSTARPRQQDPGLRYSQPPRPSRQAFRESVTAHFKNSAACVEGTRKFNDAVRIKPAFKGLASDADFNNDAKTLRITGPAGSNLRGLLKELFLGVKLNASMG